MKHEISSIDSKVIHINREICRKSRGSMGAERNGDYFPRYLVIFDTDLRTSLTP